MTGFIIALVWYLVASGTESFATTAEPIYYFLWWWYVLTSICMFFITFTALNPAVTDNFLDKMPIKMDMGPGMCFGYALSNFVITRALIYWGMVKVSQALTFPVDAPSSPLTAGIVLIVLGSLIANGLTVLAAAYGEVTKRGY